ncbi:hypothetical protein GWI33_018035 [Rhynchophorus ferrugineus]|uniref:Uncharacterized protein n=1 Tax=Rhynchophorus ferrugineus TaxID=354439 RepID=A0A834HWZ1_RHYFE|nr:hypothetical protein GWI33_018035 [Rhynchophorus ferrugineus]
MATPRAFTMIRTVRCKVTGRPRGSGRHASPPPSSADCRDDTTRRFLFLFCSFFTMPRRDVAASPGISGSLLLAWGKKAWGSRHQRRERGKD